MLVRHATLESLLPAIRREGLLTAKSQGRLKAVWLHKPSRTHWAAHHTVRRHGGRVEDVAVLELDVPRRLLRRSAVRGLWYCTADVPPGRFGRLIGFQEFSA